MASVIAARTDNKRGIAGVCPDGKIMSVAISGKKLGLHYAWEAAGIRWAVNHGARVINLSVGDYYDSPWVDAAVLYAHTHGAVLVASMPDHASTRPAYPAANPDVIAVGATTNKDQPWLKMSWKPTNPYFDLVMAPGLLIPAYWKRDVCGCRGTSYATAEVSGLAALILSVRPDLTPDQVTYAIERGADPIDGSHSADGTYGWGRIDCYKSLKIALALPHRKR